MRQRYSVVKTVIVPNNISLNSFILISKDYLATQMSPQEQAALHLRLGSLINSPCPLWGKRRTRHWFVKPLQACSPQRWCLCVCVDRFIEM